MRRRTREAGGALRCAAGHSFDIARQGYVNLVPGRADTPEMVEARDAFLRAGHFRALTAALAEEAREAVSGGGSAAAEGGSAAGGVVIDSGRARATTSRRVLDALPGARGIAIDASPAALRRAARAHERAAAVGADAWKPLPFRDGIATIVLSVFAPRNASEIARVLAPPASGRARRRTPRRHAHHPPPPRAGRAARPPSVPDDKEDRLDAQLAGDFELAERRTIEHAMFLTRDECAQLVRMGPSAWHVDERSVAERLATLPDPLTVTASMTLSRYAA